MDDVIQVWSAPNSMTRLPCDIAAPSRNVAMMLWFKDGDRMPIYTSMFEHGLKYNSRKSEIMALKAPKPKQPRIVPSVNIEGVVLKLVHSFKYLGSPDSFKAFCQSFFRAACGCHTHAEPSMSWEYSTTALSGFCCGCLCVLVVKVGTASGQRLLNDQTA
ncbi:unnamed protein product [Diatraea saccharalis]|uniref:Uncharacterized protein n=1 Tax=Diatraea saccharalis TaxID=40085 RepID=A0A9N9R3B3_9NEOP|nr:unnamed protein product [Diatraea saccharalis]